jgi:ribosome maturation factor RimP
MATVEATVRQLVEPLVTPHDIELVDVEHGPGLLRIYLDFIDPHSAIDLDTITRFSEQISDLLDTPGNEDLIPGRYTLEVSSPGLERPLRTKEQFQRFVGTPVNVKTKPNVEGERRFRGTVIEATDTHVTIGDPPRQLRYEDIDKAKTIFEWGPTPKKTPSKPQQQNKKTKKATTS